MFDKLKLELLRQIGKSAHPEEVMRSSDLRAVYAGIKSQPADKKADYGKAVNQLKSELKAAIAARREQLESAEVQPLDVTAPMDVNAKLPGFLSATSGSAHPLMSEIDRIVEIFGRMGFVAEESREIDDQYHMFESLNFPADHPARDEYDTFVTTETDAEGERLLAPAHTSTMQNRTLRKYRDRLAAGDAIAAIVPDRVFRNEDVDARHSHTFYQLEGVYVARGVHAGMLIATLKTFLEEYYGRALEVRLNPFYFPFTEPSFEMALSCPFCGGDGSDCKVCSGEGWIELLGSGMIHPNVLRAADIDPEVYTGFAFGCGIDRLVMMKHGIEDVRHFHSGKLEFLRQFA